MESFSEFPYQLFASSTDLNREGGSPYLESHVIYTHSSFGYDLCM